MRVCFYKGRRSLKQGAKKSEKGIDLYGAFLIKSFLLAFFGKRY